MKFFKYVFLFILFIGIFSCHQEEKQELPPYISIEGFTQGTTFSVIYRSKDTVSYKTEIKKLLSDIDSSLSTYNDSSVISKINRNQSSTVDFHFRKVYETSREVSEATNGAFDITVGPLVEAYGFGKSDKIDLDSNKVDSLLDFVGYQKISIKNNQIVKSDSRIQIDMNAVAQGYTVEVIAHFLEEKNIDNYLVEVGGEVKARGINDKGEIWKIGIDKPVEGNNTPGKNLTAIVKLKDRSLATSGNYRKFYEKDGIKYSHTIYPSTGYPARSNMLSVTVFAENCARADALATAFMVMGIEKSRKFVSDNNSISALFIYSDNKGKYKVDYSEDLEEFIFREY